MNSCDIQATMVNDISPGGPSVPTDVLFSTSMTNIGFIISVCFAKMEEKLFSNFA